MATPPNVFVAYLARKLEAGGSESTIYLDRITTRTGETISTSNFATFGRGILTVNPDGDGESSYPEYCSFTAVDSGDVALTGVTRGLSALDNTEVAANKRFHEVGTPVVFSFGAHNYQDLLDYVDNEVAAATVGTANAVTGIAGETISAAPALVYLKNDGKWWLTDADTAATIENVQLGLALSAVAADASITNGIVRKGLVPGFTGLVAGTTYYASNTAGEISTSTGTNSLRVGEAKSATELYFDPVYYELPTGEEKKFLLATTGMISMYGGSSAPTGFLLCNGQTVSRTTYANLFSVISTNYGVGDGSTTFNVPDLRSSFPVGFGQKVKTFTFEDADVNTSTDVITVGSNDYLYTGQSVALTNSGGALPTGLSATTYYVIRESATTIKLATSRANADDGTAVDITAASGGGTHTLTLTLTDRTIGAEGGEENHQITTEELASHSHSYPFDNGSGSNAVVQPGAITSAGFTSVNGSDTPHNNIPPYVTVNYIIKT